MPMGGNYAGNGNWSRQTQDNKRKPTLKKPTKAEKAAARKQAKERDINVNRKSPGFESYITTFDYNRIRSGIKTVWGNPRCREVVIGLLNAVASKSNPLEEGGDIEKLFELLLTQRGGGLTRTKVPGSAGYGSVSGSFRNGDASVTAPADYDGYTPDGQLGSDIWYAFNELMHLAGRNGIYTDRQFSNAIKANPVWAKLTNPDPNSPPLVYPLDNTTFSAAQKKQLNDLPGDGPWSKYFHTVVTNVCFK